MEDFKLLHSDVGTVYKLNQDPHAVSAEELVQRSPKLGHPDCGAFVSVPGIGRDLSVFIQ